RSLNPSRSSNPRGFSWECWLRNRLLLAPEKSLGGRSTDWAERMKRKLSTADRGPVARLSRSAIARGSRGLCASGSRERWLHTAKDHNTLRLIPTSCDPQDGRVTRQA